MTERELAKEELGCGIVIMFIVLVFLLWWTFSDDNPEPRYTPTAPVEEKQATNNELMKEIKKLQNGY